VFGRVVAIAHEDASRVSGVCVPTRLHSPQRLHGFVRAYHLCPSGSQSMCLLSPAYFESTWCTEEWRDGTRALLFEPLDLLTRLVAAIAPPRFRLLRYFGVLGLRR
jgi:hypothetical protein